MVRAGRKEQKDNNENRLHDDRNNDPVVIAVPGTPAGCTCLQYREGSLCEDPGRSGELRADG